MSTTPNAETTSNPPIPSTERDRLQGRLQDVGLSAQGRLQSTGIARHLERLEAGQVSPGDLSAYADNLQALSVLCELAGPRIPADFWDVRTPAMDAAGMDEYKIVAKMNRPEFAAYVSLLDRCFQHLETFKSEGKQTAVATALTLLQEAAVYVRAGHTTEMTALRPHLRPAQQAIVLWQLLVVGTNRQIPFIHRDAYTHRYWGRFNVVEIWRFHANVDENADQTWGLSGFSERFIGDATNTNQIEHMTITALAQMVLGIPAPFLDVVEELEWMLRKGTKAASRADEQLNRTVCKYLCSGFHLEDLIPACERLTQELAAE